MPDQAEELAQIKGPGFAAFLDLHDSTYAWDQNSEAAGAAIQDLYSLVEKHVGSPDARVANFTGDGFLLLFTSIEGAVSSLSRIIQDWEPFRLKYVDRYTSHGTSAPDRFFLTLRTGVSFGNFGQILIKGVTHYSGSGINKAQRCEAASKEHFNRASIGGLKYPEYVFIDSSAENLIRSRSDFHISPPLQVKFKGFLTAGTSPNSPEPEARNQYIHAVWPKSSIEPRVTAQDLSTQAKARANSDVGDRLMAAATAIRSAGVMQSLAETSVGQSRKKLIEEAVAAYRTALSIYSPGSTRGEYINTQLNLGASLRAHADLLSGNEKLQKLEEAAIAQREAIKHSSPENSGSEFAIAQNNLGNILRNQAGLLAGEQKQKKLRDAVAAYNEALRVYTHSLDPKNHAMTQNNIANAMADQTGALAGGERFDKFEEAIAAYRTALEYFTLGTDPVRYAGTHNNMGTALKNQAFLLDGSHRAKKLEDAVLSYREALRVYDAESHPAGYSMTANNLAIALKEQALLLPPNQREPLLSEAVSLHKSALQIYSPESSPDIYAIFQGNLGDTLAALAGSQSGERQAELRQEALQAYTLAMKVHTAENYPDRHEKLLSKIASLKS